MFKVFVSLLVLVSLSTTHLGQQVKNYNILCKKDCSYSSIARTLLDIYRDVAGNDKIMDFKMKDIHFNFGKIEVPLDTKPTPEQIEKLLTSKELVSYEFILNKKVLQEGTELDSKLQKKGFKYPEYNLVLKYHYKADPTEEIQLLKELFGRKDYLFEKDPNQLRIMIPSYKAEDFIKQLRKNEQIVFIQEL